ncbi:MAG: collagen-like protein, partial [Proteobacteria bacterium]|nr:collagen-like protein [Pseudomonadota bacterium]
MDTDILVAQDISLRFSIIKGDCDGEIVYRETHITTTTDLGLFWVTIGQGLNPIGEFSEINWGTSGHCIKVEMDPNGGSDFITLGTEPFYAVPYALHALNGGGTEQTLEIDGTILSLTPNGGSVALPPGPQGLPGQDGQDGEDGEDGQDGENGEDGEDGQDGEQGDQGEQGETGPQGEQG